MAYAVFKLLMPHWDHLMSVLEHNSIWHNLCGIRLLQTSHHSRIDHERDQLWGKISSEVIMQVLAAGVTAVVGVACRLAKAQ